MARSGVHGLTHVLPSIPSRWPMCPIRGLERSRRVVIKTSCRSPAGNWRCCGHCGHRSDDPAVSPTSTPPVETAGRGAGGRDPAPRWPLATGLGARDRSGRSQEPAPCCSRAGGPLLTSTGPTPPRPPTPHGKQHLLFIVLEGILAAGTESVSSRFLGAALSSLWATHPRWRH